MSTTNWYESVSRKDQYLKEAAHQRQRGVCRKLERLFESDGVKLVFFLRPAKRVTRDRLLDARGLLLVIIVAIRSLLISFSGSVTGYIDRARCLPVEVIGPLICAENSDQERGRQMIIIGLTISDETTAIMAPTPIEARLPASISKSPPLVYAKKDDQIMISTKHGISAHHDVDDAAIECGGRDQPRHDAGDEARDRTRNAAPLVRLAPGDTKCDWSNTRPEDDPHKRL